MIKYWQVLANLVEFELIEFEEIETLIKTIHKLIMDLKSICSNREVVKWRTFTLGQAEIYSRIRGACISYDRIVLLKLNRDGALLKQLVKTIK